MSAIMERPTHLLADPTAGLELSDGLEVSLEATRHLFLAANLLDPARQRDIGFTRGGEEYDNVCLRRTQGRLPRCTITPLEVWGEVMPLELFPEGVKPLQLKGMAQEDLGINRAYMTIGKPVFFYPHYPGYMILDILGVASGAQRGAIEVELLRGVDAADPEVVRLNDLFFGPDYTPPVALRLIEEHIKQVAEKVADPDVHTAANTFLQSAAQSREYMHSIVDLGSTQLQQRVHQYGHTYQLTSKLRSFMDQLEIAPPRIGVGEQLADTARQAVSSTISSEALDQLAARDSQFVEKLGGVIAMAVGEAVKAALGTLPPATPAEPPAPEPKRSK